MKSQSIVHLLNESDNIYWILDLEDEVHSIWVIWTSGLQEHKGNFFSRSRVEQATIFGRDMKNFDFFEGLLGGAGLRAPAPIHLPLKVHKGRLLSVRRG